MAATLTVQQATALGLAVTYQGAAAGGDTVAPNDRGAVLIRNGSGSAITATLVVPGNTKYGQAQPDVAIVVPAGTDRFVGPLGQDLADPNDGLVHITYSSVTSVTVATVSI